MREFKGDFFRNEIKMMEIIYDSRQFLIENRIDRGLSLKIKNSSLPYFSSCLENGELFGLPVSSDKNVHIQGDRCEHCRQKTPTEDDFDKDVLDPGDADRHLPACC